MYIPEKSDLIPILGYCLEVSEGQLTTHSCSDFLFGCPGEPWKSHEFYKCKN